MLKEQPSITLNENIFTLQRQTFENFKAKTIFLRKSCSFLLDIIGNSAYFHQDKFKDSIIAVI